MMNFDTREIFNELKNSGLQDKTADAIVTAINKSRVADLDNLSTKQDIANTELKIELKIADAKSELKKEINDVKLDVSEMRGDIKEINATLGTAKWFFAGIIIPLLLVALKLFFPTLFGS